MMRLLLVFYYNILPLLNLALLIGFVVCLIVLLVKLIRHKEGKKTSIILLGLIFIFANILSFGLTIFITKERIYYDESKYLRAKGDEDLIEYIPDDATEIMYSKKIPLTMLGSVVDGVSYKIDPDGVSKRIDVIIEEDNKLGESLSGMAYEQWILNEKNYYDIHINEKLLGGDNFEDYQVVYINFANGTDSQVFVNEKTGRFICIRVNHD